MKQIGTVVQDVYDLFTGPHECGEDNIQLFAKDVANIMRRRLGEDQERGNYLRISNMGKGDRQVYYDCNPHGLEEDLEPWTRIKFLYGDLIETLLIFLAREAGHKWEGEQETVELEGVKGHTDGTLDDHTIDVKSASAYGYKKFRDKTIFQDDPFGYIPQLSGYNEALGKGDKSAYLLAMDKQSGHLCLTEVPPALQIDARARALHMKEVVAAPNPPPRCHSAEPEGKSGNMKLPVGCSYCKHKWECWPGLRQFTYSRGPVWLTEVVNEPRVLEVTMSGERIEKEFSDES